MFTFGLLGFCGCLKDELLKLCLLKIYPVHFKRYVVERTNPRHKRDGAFAEKSADLMPLTLAFLSIVSLISSTSPITESCFNGSLS